MTYVEETIIRKNFNRVVYIIQLHGHKSVYFTNFNDVVLAIHDDPSLLSEMANVMYSWIRWYWES